jgi:hypothetical protein
MRAPQHRQPRIRIDVLFDGAQVASIRFRHE